MSPELTAAHEALAESADILQSCYENDPDLTTALRLLGKAIEHTLNVVELLDNARPLRRDQ